MNTLIVSPLLIPLATLVATLLARRSPRVVTALSLAGALALTAAGLVLEASPRRGRSSPARPVAGPRPTASRW